MSTVNKILNGLIAIMAVICCIFSYEMHQRRVELRQRADYLAQLTVKTAEAIDDQGEYSTELHLTAKINDKTVDWKSYHLARDEQGKYPQWEKNVDNVQFGIEQLALMKKDLADNLITISESLELESDQPLKPALNSSNTYKANASIILDQARLFKANKDQLSNGLVQASKAIKKDQQLDGFTGLRQQEEVKQNISHLVANISQLHGNRSLLANGLKDLAASFPKDQEGEILFPTNWSKLNFNSDNPKDLEVAFNQVYKDLRSLNDKLFELKVATRQVEQQRSQLAVKDNVIEEINQENDTLKNAIGQKKAVIARLNRQLADYIDNDIPTLPRHVQANVLEVNDRFNFILINKGKNQGLKTNVELLIHNKGKFVCKVKISKVMENKAVCDILPHPLKSTAVNLPIAGYTAVTTR